MIIAKKILFGLRLRGRKSLEFLDRYNLDYHKVASAMIIDTFFK